MPALASALLLPFPPPSITLPIASGSALGSESMAPALGPLFIPTLPFPLGSPISTPLLQQYSLDPAQLRAMYVPAPNPVRSRGCSSVSFFLKLLISITNN